MIQVHSWEPARLLILLEVTPVLLIVIQGAAIRHHVMPAGIAAPGTNDNYLHVNLDLQPIIFVEASFV